MWLKRLGKKHKAGVPALYLVPVLRKIHGPVANASSVHPTPKNTYLGHSALPSNSHFPVKKKTENKLSHAWWVL